MADDQTDDGQFIITFPVWMCVRKSTPLAFMGGTEGPDMKYVLAFTDRDGAEEYIENRGKQEEAEAKAVPTRTGFVNLLTNLSTKEGYTHVIFDDRGLGMKWKRAFPIKAVLDNLTRKPE